MIHQAERDILMAADYLRGVPVKLIAPDPMSNAQLYRALQRLGVDGRRIGPTTQPAWWGDAGERFRAGASIKSIAEQMGRDRAAVQRALRKMGLR
jgi:hypothetical protein